MVDVMYKLSDRPKWWLPRLFKWLAIISAGIGLVTWLMSAWLYSMISFDSAALGEEGEEVKERKKKRKS